MYLPTELLISRLEQHRIANHSVLVIFEIAGSEIPRSRKSTQCILVCPTEHFQKHS